MFSQPHELTVLAVTDQSGVSAFKYRFNIDNDWEPKQSEFNVFEMKLMTTMLTKMGFTSLQLGQERINKPRTIKDVWTKYYIGISGGGWRALAGHMGAFRALSQKGALPKVDMLSSVSGGTWFLAKLSFDDIVTI